VYLRSIFVSVDTVIEGWLRSLARLKPRRQLQIPPDEVRQGAANRYLREQDDSIDLETTRIGYYAGFASRATGLVIDLLILAVIYTFMGWFLGIAIDMLGINLESVFLFMSEQWLDQIGQSLLRLLTQSTMALIFFSIYHTLFWALFGQTFGSALMGYRVVKFDGNLPGIFRSLLRVSVGYGLSLSLLFVGAWMILFDSKRQALHDKLFRTYVVYTWDARPSERFLVDQVNKLELGD